MKKNETQLERRDSRRRFLVAGASVAAAGLIWTRAQDDEKKPSASATESSYGAPAPEALHAAYPSHDPELVRAIVGASHTNIDKVRALVTERPALAKAAWDWGYGDWESALGAASHMGRADISQLLIDHGARPNIFTFAMMGQLAAVRAFVESNPGLQSLHGPHGITLLRHAKAGGDSASSVVAYLEQVGGADVAAKSLPVTDEEQKTYLGTYAFGSGERDAFEISKNRRGSLWIKRRGESFGRVLNRVEEHAFAPGGAQHVRVRFQVEDGRAIAMSIHDPAPEVVAQRVTE